MAMVDIQDNQKHRSIHDWDWSAGNRQIADLADWHSAYDYMEEPYVSPDGVRVAAIVKTPDETYGIRVNDELRPEQFDKIWNLRFGPDGRLRAIVSDGGEWTLCIEGDAWQNRFDYIWSVQASRDGEILGAAVQSGGEYRAVVDDRVWENGFAAISDVTLSPEGRHLAAVAPQKTIKEGDIFGFQEGCYALVLDGSVMAPHLVNIWQPQFSPDGSQVAAAARLNLYEYSVLSEEGLWPQTFACVWSPRFHPRTGEVTAPVKTSKGWLLMAKKGAVWDRAYKMITDHRYAPDGSATAAIVAPKYGKWTVAVDGSPWPHAVDGVIADLTVSTHNRRVACSAQNRGAWTIIVDGRPWSTRWDRVGQPVFNGNGEHVAARVEKGGKKTLVIDGKALTETYETIWDPVWGPDQDRILLRAITEEGCVIRRVISL
jgi:hypothetical protein